MTTCESFVTLDFLPDARLFISPYCHCWTTFANRIAAENYNSCDFPHVYRMACKNVDSAGTMYCDKFRKPMYMYGQHIVDYMVPVNNGKMADLIALLPEHWSTIPAVLPKLSPDVPSSSVGNCGPF